ncbi:uncharacterized protein LOC135976185 [Chrysemys picta bellii]|uniref:uncharacterized protein LOC135976185 n=1 Tax=Chrysemys picta bellii TaxID=8478 RepID=UPI0032B29983
MSTSDLNSSELQSGCSPARESRTMSTSDAAIKLKLARLEAKERESEHKRRLELRQLEISAMQAEHAREEAAHKRAMEAEAARAEAEAARVEAEAAREAVRAAARVEAEAAREAARAAARAEAEAAAHERAMEAQREARKHELAVMESKRRNPPPAGSTSPKIHKWERLCPQYDESSDIAEYFITFERLCTLHAIPEDQKMTTLIAKLTGRALDIFNKMPIDDASNYGKFKELVLKQFQVTPETYRVKFRSLKRGSGLSNVAYANEMRDLVDKWVRGRGITSFEGMCDLVTQEHFLNMCSDEVKQYLWDKKVNAVGELAEYADSYEQAQAAIKHKPLAEGYKVGGKQNHRFTPGSGKKEPGQSPPHSPVTRPKFPTQAGDPRRCFHCNSPGHLRSSCPKLKESKPPLSHVSSVAFSPEGPEGTPTSYHTSLVDMGPGEADREHIKVVKIDGMECLGWRDTGAQFSLVRPSVVPDASVLTGQTTHIKGVGPQRFPVPLAKVHVEWEGRERDLLVGMLEDIPADMLLGNDFFSRTRTVSVVTRSMKKGCEGEAVPADDCRSDAAEQPTPPAPGNMVVGDSEGAPRDGAGTLEPIGELGEGLSDRTVQGGGVLPNMGETEPGLCLAEDNRLPGVGAGEMQSVLRDGDAISRVVCQEFAARQRADPSLESIRQCISEGTPGREGGEKFFEEDGKLYRQAPVGKNQGPGQPYKQLVVPSQHRGELVLVAHDSPFAGHLGVQRTYDRLRRNFYWPGIQNDVRDYCRTCAVCQERKKPGGPQKAPLRPLPIIQEAFQRVAIDIVGPMPRPTRRGNKYILVVVDFATRYPEAIALSNIEAETVARALLTIFSRVGFPKEILSDRGANFMSQLFNELWKVCGVKQLKTAPYHPQANGLVERFNGTLKSMLGMYAKKRGQSWDELLPFLLYAYREVPQESTGFSPFDLLYGRKVRGPLDLIRDTWEGCNTVREEPVTEYVQRFRRELKDMMEIVQNNLQSSQAKQKAWYDKNTCKRTFDVGDLVMVLGPAKKFKMQNSWEGPFEVVEVANEDTYKVKKPLDDAVPQLVHVNRLKAYHSRAAEVNMICCVEGETEAHPLTDLMAECQDGSSLESIEICSELTPLERREALSTLQKYSEVFSNKPGRTHLLSHRILTKGAQPPPSRPYRATGKVKEQIQAEIQSMLDLGVIKDSDSAWASPVVLVPKRDGTVRFCVDYRKLNAVTVTDAYPMPRIDDMLDVLSQAKYLSTFDLTKGYWQIPLEGEAQQKSAFITDIGLYEFTVLPFGLVNAGATFQRLVNRVLNGLQHYARAYIDDIAVFSNTWGDHKEHLEVVLSKLKEAGLTVKPSKCKIGAAKVPYLGHWVGGGKISPDPLKVEAIVKWPVPQTKRQVQSFIGLANYYRRFVVGFSDVVSPITDLCKKHQPNKVIWSEACQKGFNKVKALLSAKPVLASPDFEKPFELCTDASDTGLGAVLMQTGEDSKKHPIAFLSKKLSPAEQNYSVIEKECYAIVWAVKQLRPYLFNRRFRILTDHSPLVWLHRTKGTNSKLLRWSLVLQEFDMEITHIKGKENWVADALSRKEEL